MGSFLIIYIWLRSAGGDWDLASSSTTKVSVNHRGDVLWKPPIIFKSQCEINVEFFPFDTQVCQLKLGTWTHNGFLIDLRHTAQKEQDDKDKLYTFDNCLANIDYSIDLSEFVENVEWDLLSKTFWRKLGLIVKQYIWELKSLKVDFISILRFVTFCKWLIVNILNSLISIIYELSLYEDGQQRKMKAYTCHLLVSPIT